MQHGSSNAESLVCQPTRNNELGARSLRSACLNQDVAIDGPSLRQHDVVFRVIGDTSVSEAIEGLGWTNGVPGAAVVIRQLDSSKTLVDSGLTDVAGRRLVKALAAGS
jgi:hypothetical protein